MKDIRVECAQLHLCIGPNYTLSCVYRRFMCEAVDIREVLFISR